MGLLKLRCVCFFVVMKFICWNCRGVGGKGKDEAIRNIVMHKKANFVGLVETKHSHLSEVKIRKWWGQREVDWCDSQV